jgi:serine/threonine-protein kinase RsbW
MTARPSPDSSITIDAEVGRLADIRAFVRARVGANGGDATTTADLVQAVDELVCNVIEHGYAGRPGLVEVAFELQPETFVVRIRDAAPPFDPGSVPEPRLDLPLDTRPLGGMGVHLARTLTDGLDHRILPSGGNEVTVRKLRGGTATGEARDGHHDRSAHP